MPNFNAQAFLTDFVEALSTAQNPAAILAAELQISLQSAYRKLKGESELTANEYFKLLNYLQQVKYNGQQPEQLFEFSYNSGEQAALQLHELLKQMLHTASAKKITAMHYVANDVSLLQLLQIKELAQFKMHYLLHTVYSKEHSQPVPFNFETVNELNPFETVARQLVLEYQKVPETVIIGPHAFQHLLYQIHYYFQAGFIATKEVALELLQKVDVLLNHLLKQAQLQQKFLPNQDSSPTGVGFQLYFNRLMNVNNVVLLDSAPAKHSIIITHGLNFLHSTNTSYYNKQLIWVKNLLHKSQLISGGSERDQIVFKNQLQQQISMVEKVVNAESTWF